MKNKLFLVAIISLGFISHIFPQQTFRKAIFLHRSVGGQLWSQAGTPVTIPGEVDIYNITKGYTGNEVVSMDEVLFPIQGYGGTVDNEWYQWHRIFDKINTDDDIYGDYLDDTTYSIIILKTCFPQSNLYGGVGGPSDTLTIHMDRTVYGSKWHWRSIIKKMESYPNKFFVIWTNIPLLEENTNATEAGYVNWFCTWAKDTLAAGLDATYGAFPPNVYVFDYFHLIDSLNYMPPWLADGGQDEEHPSPYQNAIIDPVLVQETFDAAIAYEILPVELISFTASIVQTGVELNWSTATELNNDMFEIQKKTDNGHFITIGFIKGHGTSTQINNYSFLDKIKNSGKYLYRLKQIDFGGYFEYSKIVEVDFNQLISYTLEQNYPNPFNPTTKIRFNLPESGNVKLTINNILGEEVRTLINEYKESGVYTINFDASELNSGMYIYKIEVNGFSQTHKMILIK
jgi:hypothetical protein